MKFELTLIGLVIGTFLTLSVFDMLQGSYVIITFLYVLYGVGIYIYNKQKHDQELAQLRDANNAEMDLGTCFEYTNKILRKIENSDTITFDEGRIHSSYREYPKGKLFVPFRAFIAQYQGSGLRVLIIFNIMTKDIAELVKEPSPYRRTNPWDGFTPFKSAYAVSGMNTGHSVRGRKPSLKISYDDDFEDDSDQFEDQFASMAKESGRVLQNKRGKDE